MPDLAAGARDENGGIPASASVLRAGRGFQHGVRLGGFVRQHFYRLGRRTCGGGWLHQTCSSDQLGRHCRAGQSIAQGRSRARLDVLPSPFGLCYSFHMAVGLSPISLSIVAPAHNEEESLPALVTEIAAALDPMAI